MPGVRFVHVVQAGNAESRKNLEEGYMKNKNSVLFNFLFLLHYTIFSGRVKKAWKKIPVQYRGSYKKVKSAIICGLLWKY